MAHPAPSGQENRMTQLLLAQICRQAEAIRALSQAALTSSPKSAGELEPLQDCLAMLQLYAGMLDDRRVSAHLAAPAALPQLPQFQPQLEAPAPTTAPTPSIHTSVGLMMPRVVFGTTSTPSSTPPSSEGMSSSPSSPSTSTSAFAPRFRLVPDEWGAPSDDCPSPHVDDVSPPQRLHHHLQSTAAQHHQRQPHNHRLDPKRRPPPSLPSSSATTAASSIPPNAEVPKRRANNVPVDQMMGRGKSSTRALVRRCGECQRTNTSQWRKGPHGLMLCNACGIRAFRAKDKVSGHAAGYHHHHHISNHHEPAARGNDRRHPTEHLPPSALSARDVHPEPKRSTIHRLLN